MFALNRFQVSGGQLTSARATESVCNLPFPAEVVLTDASWHKSEIASADATSAAKHLAKRAAVAITARKKRCAIVSLWLLPERTSFHRQNQFHSPLRRACGAFSRMKLVHQMMPTRGLLRRLDWVDSMVIIGVSCRCAFVAKPVLT